MQHNFFLGVLLPVAPANHSGSSGATLYNVFSTPGGVQYIRGPVSTSEGYHDACGGYHEYIGVFNISQRLLLICSPK